MKSKIEFKIDDFLMVLFVSAVVKKKSVILMEPFKSLLLTVLLRGSTRMEQRTSISQMAPKSSLRPTEKGLCYYPADKRRFTPLLSRLFFKIPFLGNFSLFFPILETRISGWNRENFAWWRSNGNSLFFGQNQNQRWRRKSFAWLKFFY